MSEDWDDCPPTGGFRLAQARTVKLYRLAAREGYTETMEALERMILGWDGDWCWLVDEVRGNYGWLRRMMGKVKRMIGA
jgi:hypothetical protein